MKPRSPALQADSLPDEPQGKPTSGCLPKESKNTNSKDICTLMFTAALFTVARK